MLSFWLVTFASLAWLGLMFGAAIYGERRPRFLATHWRYIYALSLAVHCTSWTFYGTVTQAARYGWPLPPTFLGAIFFYGIAITFMIRLVRLARETIATSLADLIATRLGKDAWLAATITLVAALGLIPYIALQLKAIAMSFAMLTNPQVSVSIGAPVWRDSALYVALAMALFAMLFGTRRASATEHNRGLVVAIAFESLFKLIAMLALGAFVWFGLESAPINNVAQAPINDAHGFMPLVFLGALAMFILPHQFHVGVVECRDDRDIKTARWLFPLYLILIALPALPLARAGMSLLDLQVPSDMYALALPSAQGQHGIALFAFLGGLSAATSMVVVSTLTLSLMIGNHWFAPGLLRGVWSRGQSEDRRGDLLLLRRIGILAIMLLAWAYSRLIGSNDALADMGAVSFSALATLTPSLAFAVWRPQTSARAAIAGTTMAFFVWAWVILPPMFMDDTTHATSWISQGPWGWSGLSPDGLFGLTGWSRLGRAVGASLFCGFVVIWWVGSWRRETSHPAGRNLDRLSLRDAGLRFLSRERVDELLSDAPISGPVSSATETKIERELSAVLGSASARLLLNAARREATELDTVAAIVEEASQDLRFNQQLLEAALQNMSQGISVVDREQCLVAWNKRYTELFHFPEHLLRVGQPIAELTRWALQYLPYRGADEAALQRRIAHMRSGTPHLTERVFPDGTVIEIRGNPMPDGGFVATYTDITASRVAERGLIQANETLEQRVVERTVLLETAKREAEQANHAKSRFLTAIGHDLLQPLHAAHLFTDALAQQLTDGLQRQSAQHIRGALDSTSSLLTGLLDMSRLEAGGLVPESRAFPLSEVLEPLASEFKVLAAEHGLSFASVPTKVWVHTDPQLLRRILQNFLANAVRYTSTGGILLGVRRSEDRLRIEVHDTGPGISIDEQQIIFQEFRRGQQSSGQGLGLGLSIAERIAQLLSIELSVRSCLGRGSSFAVTLPKIYLHISTPEVPRVSTGLHGLRILALDNDALALDALRQILVQWGGVVLLAQDRHSARAVMDAADADVWLFDFHLDAGDTGVQVALHLAEHHERKPCLILTADTSAEVRDVIQSAGLTMLNKPIRPLALKSVLDRLLAARQT